MPKFMHALDNEKNLLVDTDYRTALYDGQLYRDPYALNDEMDPTPISRNVFRTMDFSEIDRASLLDNNRLLVIVPVGGNAVFMSRNA